MKSQKFGLEYTFKHKYICCLNFWDEACWFLSLRVLGLLSSSLLLFPQRFGRYVLRPSSSVCRTREPSRNFELRPLLKPRGSPVLIPLAITGDKYYVFLYCYSPVVRIEPFLYFNSWLVGWLVFWHINHCRLFNAKSSLYIHIKYIWFGLVWFYGISNIVGYLMPNPLYTYVLNIYDLV